MDYPKVTNLTIISYTEFVVMIDVQMLSYAKMYYSFISMVLRTLIIKQERK